MYTVRKNPPKEIQDALQIYDTLTQRLLYERNITTQEKAEVFFKKEWAAINPYQYKDMEKAVRRILDAVEREEVIGIYSDYDCDGIPAAAALHSTLHALGHKNSIYYVPDRNSEGFGLSKKGVNKMIDSGASVVCVLDCGTSSPGEIAEMEQKGIETIIIDHHLAGEEIPSAFAVLNPTTEKIKQPHPCAAGVTYIVIQALIQEAHKRKNKEKPPLGWEKWQLDIIGMATLSDMVPLHGINRQLAHYGLQVFRKSPRPGVQALCSALKIDQQKATQDDLSFSIIPRVNAASRMGEAEMAFRLLTTNNINEAMMLTEHLTKLNNKRKTTVATMVRAAQKQAQNKNEEKTVWVFGSREWKPSLVGLVAHKLADTHKKTVFVWGQAETEEKTVIKGSCRSLHRDVFSLMRDTSGMFIEAGGHKNAGGFTLKDGAEMVLEEALNKTEGTQKEKEGNEKYPVDCECTIDKIGEIYTLYKQFAPFGMKNEVIRIAIPQCTIHKKVTFGKKGDHIRYTLADGTGFIDAIAFFAKDNKDIDADINQTMQAIVGHIETNTFRNTLQIKITLCIA